MTKKKKTKKEAKKQQIFINVLLGTITILGLLIVITFAIMQYQQKESIRFKQCFLNKTKPYLTITNKNVEVVIKKFRECER